MEKKIRYAIDLDGILCTEVKHWLGERPNPILANIKKVNKLFDEGHIIFIHTSRLPEDRIDTEYLLKTMGVKYDALVMGKLRADKYIDDKNDKL